MVGLIGLKTGHLLEKKAKNKSINNEATQI